MPSKSETRRRDTATTLAGQLVRARDQVCQWGTGECSGVLEVAHIISRGHDRLRCDLTNLRLLCVNHHRRVDDHRADWSEIIPAGELDRLDALARDVSWKRPHLWWSDELARLKALARAEGIAA